MRFPEIGDLFTCGEREHGKLGHDLWSLGQADTTEKIIQVACGAHHTVALNGRYILMETHPLYTIKHEYNTELAQ